MGQTVFEYAKLISETDQSGVSRFFFHYKGSRELVVRDLIEALNLVGLEGWEAFSIHPQIMAQGEEFEFEGVHFIREAFFRRKKEF